MNKNRRIGMVVTVVLLTGLGWGAWRVDASAMDATVGTISVNTLEDELNTDGDCSLREAIEAANTNLVVDGCAAGEAAAVDTITFEVEGTITVAEQLVVTAGGPLVIDGGDEITISGGETTRVIYVDSGSTLTLQRLTIADGFTEGENGAGLYNNEANVTIQECQFSDNRMGESSYGGGFFSDCGKLTVMDSLFERNGSSVQDTYGGGGFLYGGQAEFVRTTFLSNQSGGINYMYYYCSDWDCGWFHISEPGGGGLNIYGDYYFSRASVIIQESSFIANKSGEGGGGITNGGTTTIINSTFSNNTAEGGEYSKGGGEILNEGTLTLINSTLSENSYSRDKGGGITGSAYLANSILANNDPSDCTGGISDGGHNISSDDSCGFDIANSSLPNTDPLLGPLQDNAGPTETYALLDGSPAIDAGSPTDCPETDQRGVIRPIDGDGDGEAVCDIGSFELDKGIAFHPVYQSSSGGLGTTLVYNLELYNFTGQTDSFTLALGSHAWETSLSTEQLGPLENYAFGTFTISVTIPLDAAWYQTDTVTVTATSKSNPGETFTPAQVITQAYALPQISVDPLTLISNQWIDESVTQALTISNGNGVPLDYAISPIAGGVLMLHLDEADAATSFFDSSGYGNHGVCVDESCPTAGVAGKYGSAAHFDGVNDYISVADAPSLNPQLAITISVWILADDWNGDPWIVQKGVDDIQYRLWAFDGILAFSIPSITGVGIDVPSTGNWHHVVGIYDGTQMQLWVDGVLRNYIGVFSPRLPTSVDPVYIGAHYPEAPEGEHFSGTIDELLIFDRGLNADEIQELFISGAQGMVPWLTIDPLSGSIPSNSSLPVQVTFDATGLQLGSYSTTLSIFSNDPLNPYVQVPVRMDVLPPYWYLPFIYKAERD